MYCVCVRRLAVEVLEFPQHGCSATARRASYDSSSTEAVVTHTAAQHKQAQRARGRGQGVAPELRETTLRETTPWASGRHVAFPETTSATARLDAQLDCLLTTRQSGRRRAR